LCKSTGLIMCGVVLWAGYCVRAGHIVQVYSVNNVWNCTSSHVRRHNVHRENQILYLSDFKHIVTVHTDMCYCHGTYWHVLLSQYILTCDIVTVHNDMCYCHGAY
jgi:hypothetical protein